MSRLVERSDIVDYVTYQDSRAETRPVAIANKARRRVHLNEHLTLLFENRDTLRYQIQEIMRIERIIREVDIEHEIAAYNSILGAPGDLGCVLLIEIVDPAKRERLLSEWVELPNHLYVALEDGVRVPATFDQGQVGEERLSAVQYLQFPVAARVPVAIGSDFNGLESEVKLTAEQRTALTEDLTRL